MTVFVLQSFTIECGAPRSRAEKKTTAAAIPRSPSKIAHSLQTEHRIENVKRNHRDIMHAGSSRRNPGRDRARLH